MKQKRTYVTLLLVVALLALGIAYAYITDVSMSVKATATASDEGTALDIAFTAGQKDAQNTTTGVDVTFEGLDSANAIVKASGFKVKGDKAVATLTLTNRQTDEVKAKITELTTAVDNQWYNVTVSGLENDQIVVPGTPVTVTVTIEMIKTPSTTDDADAASIESTVGFKAVAVSTAVAE